MIYAPPLSAVCAWCHEPFTPHKQRRGSPWTITCKRDCTRKYTGLLAKHSGSQAKAAAARRAQGEAATLALLEKLPSKLEAYRLGRKHGYHVGYAALPKWGRHDGRAGAVPARAVRESVALPASGGTELQPGH